MQRLFRKTSKGVISYLYREGSNALIFLHGLGGSSNNWARLTKYLDPEFSLYYLDLLGHGRTEANGWNYRISDQCIMLDDFIRDTIGENFGIVGNSYGGWIASTFASSYGHPKCLVLEDSAGLNPTVGESAGEQVEKFIDKLQNFGRENVREVMRKIIYQNSTGEEKLSPEMLAEIKSNTVVLWGERDHMIDLSYAEKLNTMIWGSTLQLIKGGGHVPHYTHPDEVAHIINECCGT